MKRLLLYSFFDQREGLFSKLCLKIEVEFQKVYATIQKGIVGGFEFTVLQRNLKEGEETK